MTHTHAVPSSLRQKSTDGSAASNILRETTSLLWASEQVPDGHSDDRGEPDSSGSWQSELKFLSTNSSFLVLASLLYYSVPVTSIIIAGRLGPSELGAVSLANVTSNVTGIVVFQGLATTLDTLCAQAYGSGNFALVGLHVQRMTFLLWCISIPVAALWFNASGVLSIIIPDQRVAQLAGLYLKVLILGAPGIALFETVKRYLQAQGHFAAILYTLGVATAANIFMSWLLVVRLSFGFIGVPLAVVATYNVLPLLLIVYVLLFADRECWPGWSRRLFHDWMPMILLALPGLCMIEAEFLAFEILTLAASYLSTKHLAAQTIMASLSGIFWQLPFPTSIVATTRIAELIGAGKADAAKLSAKTATVVSMGIGAFNGVILSLPQMRRYILPLFTGDEEVTELVAGALPILAAMQFFDATGANGNGILRGLGRQRIGGFVSLACFYIFALPFCFFSAFYLGWELKGLWSGVTIALSMVVALEGWYLITTDWDTCVLDAVNRNSGGAVFVEEYC
ncbi:MATE transporter [Penicillium lagena]|uniref:MATE transporter n=1 Tax=Penicillium lagena TaxID=94218 RepID=UPI00254188F3|nr:MATE transporter [Penicillium lagena]KAJ5624288.1 MATE transporter [Penicillium lagena]